MGLESEEPNLGLEVYPTEKPTPETQVLERKVHYVAEGWRRHFSVIISIPEVEGLHIQE